MRCCTAYIAGHLLPFALVSPRPCSLPKALLLGQRTPRIETPPAQSWTPLTEFSEGHLAVSADIWGCHNLGGTGIWWVEVRGAAQLPAVHKFAPVSGASGRSTLCQLALLLGVEGSVRMPPWCGGGLRGLGPPQPTSAAPLPVVLPHSQGVIPAHSAELSSFSLAFCCAN